MLINVFVIKSFCVLFFFFSSRRRHTRLVSDWSSDVCSSDLPVARAGDALVVGPVFRGDWAYDRPLVPGVEPFLLNERFAAAARRLFDGAVVRRSEERRVGKEWRSRGGA